MSMHTTRPSQARAAQWPAPSGGAHDTWHCRIGTGALQAWSLILHPHTVGGEHGQHQLGVRMPRRALRVPRLQLAVSPSVAVLGLLLARGGTADLAGLSLSPSEGQCEAEWPLSDPHDAVSSESVALSLEGRDTESDADVLNAEDAKLSGGWWPFTGAWSRSAHQHDPPDAPTEHPAPKVLVEKQKAASPDELSQKPEEALGEGAVQAAFRCQDQEAEACKHDVAVEQLKGRATQGRAAQQQIQEAPTEDMKQMNHGSAAQRQGEDPTVEGERRRQPDSDTTAVDASQEVSSKCAQRCVRCFPGLWNASVKHRQEA